MKKIILTVVGYFFCSLAIAQNATLMIPNSHSKNIDALAFSKDDKYIFSGSSDCIRIWQSSNSKLLKKIDGEDGSVFIPHPLDSNIVLIISTNKINYFDITSFEITKTINCDSIRCYDGIESNDGNHLYIIGKTRRNFPTMVLWKLDLKSNFFEKIIDVSINSNFFMPTNINISSDDKLIMVNNRSDGDTYIIDVNKKQVTQIIEREKARIISFTPNGSLLAINDFKDGYDLKMLEPKSLEVIKAIKVPRSKYIVGTKKTFIWNKKNQHFIIATGSDFIEIDFNDFKLVRSVKLKDESENRTICLNHKNNILLAGTSAFIEKPPLVILYNAQTFEKIKSLSNAPLVAWDLNAYNKNKKIAVISLNGFAKNIEFKPNGLTVISEQRPQGQMGYKKNTSLAISSNDDQIAFGSSSYSTKEIYKNTDSFSNLTSVPNESFSSKSTQDIFYSPDNSLIGFLGATKVSIVNSKTYKVIKEFDNGYFGISQTGNLGAFSKNNKYVVFYGQPKNGLGESYNKVVCYNIETGIKVWEKNINAFLFKFEQNDLSISCIINSNKPEYASLNTATGDVIKSSKLPIDYIIKTAKSPDGKYLFATTEKGKGNNINQIDLSNGNLLNTFIGHSSIVWTMDVLNDNEFLISGSDDNTMRIWDIKLKKEVAKIFLFQDNSEWIVMDANGRYDASNNAMKELYYVKGKNIIPLEALYEKYFTPLLLGNILKHKELPAPDINNLKQRPKVKISYANKIRNLTVENDNTIYSNSSGTAELMIQATCSDDIIDEIRLFHNGKAVNLATRGMFVTDEGNKSDTKKYTINLTNGTNTFRAIALNSQRTESDADEIIVTYNASSNNNDNPPTNSLILTNGTPVSQVDKNATLHLIVVGINEYQNTKMSLNYAMADATSFKEEVEKDAKSIIANVKTYFVTNTTANKAGITNAFKEVQQTAKPQDVFIFYYAGHGVISKEKEFYLVPTDVSNLNDVENELLQKGVPSKLLQQYAIDIQAQKQLFILDACQSAGAFEKLLSADGDKQKSLAVVARSTGTHWMAASGAMQYANEFSSIGHGVFTYVLLQALKGEAANNKIITVNGLKNFLQIQVPQLMKKFNGAAQYPASFGFGNDFPVEVIK